MHSIGLPQLAAILVAILINWAIYQSRGPFSR
jgi:hypothetical protein